VRTYFKSWPVDEDPAELLKPQNGFSTPWGEPRHGPCDKCGGRGRTQYRCRSCLERGCERDCPACEGRMEFEDVCPACEGDGEIDRTTRRGVSVFPSSEGLRRYLAERDVDVSGYAIVVLSGEPTGDLDLDADAGAMLIEPDRVLGMCPLGPPAWEQRRSA
jgi:hypothetical protein